MGRPPLDAREWLEDMLAFNGRDADRAREVLTELDEIQDHENELAGWQRLDVRDADEAARIIADHEALSALLEQDELAAAFGGETLTEHLSAVLAYATECEAKVHALQELCASAGLLDEKDMTTDPLPLLRMFLPVD